MDTLAPDLKQKILLQYVDTRTFESLALLNSTWAEECIYVGFPKESIEMNCSNANTASITIDKKLHFFRSIITRYPAYTVTQLPNKQLHIVLCGIPDMPPDETTIRSNNSADVQVFSKMLDLCSHFRAKSITFDMGDINVDIVPMVSSIDYNNDCHELSIGFATVPQIDELTRVIKSNKYILRARDIDEIQTLRCNENLLSCTGEISIENFLLENSLADMNFEKISLKFTSKVPTIKIADVLSWTANWRNKRWRTIEVDDAHIGELEEFAVLHRSTFEIKRGYVILSVEADSLTYEFTRKMNDFYYTQHGESSPKYSINITAHRIV